MESFIIARRHAGFRHSGLISPAYFGGVQVKSDRTESTGLAGFVTPEFAEEGKLTDAEVVAFYKQAHRSLESARDNLVTAERRMNVFRAEMLKREGLWPHAI
jgi:hypothetical protein